MELSGKNFWEFADIWYQRAHKLREVWQNDVLPEAKREKAFRLWLVMFQRVQKLLPHAIKLSTPKIPAGMKPGGIDFVNTGN